MAPEWSKARVANCTYWTGIGECKKEGDNCEADEENWSDYRGSYNDFSTPSPFDRLLSFRRFTHALFTLCSVLTSAP